MGAFLDFFWHDEKKEEKVSAMSKNMCNFAAIKCRNIRTMFYCDSEERF